MQNKNCKNYTIKEYYLTEVQLYDAINGFLLPVISRIKVEGFSFSQSCQHRGRVL